MSIDWERNRIKKEFIPPGKFGLLILRRAVPDFEAELKVFEAKIAAHKSAVQKQLQSRTDEIVADLLGADAISEVFSGHDAAPVQPQQYEY